MEKKFEIILGHYFDAATVAQLQVERYGGGHINETYLLTGAGQKMILQKLNTYVFKKPVDVMENLEKISDFLKDRVAARGGDVTRERLTIIYTTEGKSYVENESGFWRVLDFIDDTITFEVIENPKMFEDCAASFGGFQNDLATFPAATLQETIPNFHNTPDRYRQFEEAMAENKAGRLDSIADEIAFVKAHRPVCNKLMDLLNAGELPLRVTHNDTKLSNILYDAKSERPVCVIDLDTTMPGLVAYDFGDAIRGGAGTAAEDEKDITKVGVNLELFDAFTKGFLSTVGGSLTELEKDTLPDGAILMTLECGIRFLTDYLNGDVYFRTAYPEHNLVRAHNMFKMVTEMEENRAALDAIVAKHRPNTDKMLDIKEMQSLQTELQEKYKDKWGGLPPEKARDTLLWMMAEAGEAAQVIKKSGDREILEDSEARRHFTEEMCDILMYFNDVLLCYGIAPEEVEAAYRQKHEKNMHRW